jgi:hypothetical protein
MRGIDIHEQEGAVATSANWIRGIMLAGTIIAGNSWMAATGHAEVPIPKFDPKDMVPLINGPNWVDLDGDGHLDLVMKSMHQIPSPHSMSLYTFHLYTEYTSADTMFDRNTHWHTVSFPSKDKPFSAFFINTHQGATCIISDIRLVINKSGNHKKTYIIEAVRTLDETYGDAERVTFYVYRLDKGEGGNTPPFTFNIVSTFPAKTKYCSVSNAFEKELNIPEHDPEYNSHLRIETEE